MVGLPVLLKQRFVRVKTIVNRSAIINSGFRGISQSQINYQPCALGILPKDGARLDLPIAIGILAASGQIDETVLAQYEFIGELASMAIYEAFGRGFITGTIYQGGPTHLDCSQRQCRWSGQSRWRKGVAMADNLKSVVCQHFI